jgi:hypothetical protein
VYSPPSPSEEVLDALLAIGSPSRPLPLEGSAEVGPEAYLIERSRDEVIAAYQAEGAQVPAESTASVDPDGLLVIRAPFSTTVLRFSRAPQGTVYQFSYGHTLHIRGAGEFPSVDSYAAVAYDDTDVNTGEPTQQLFSAPVIEGEQWVLMVRPRRRDLRAVFLQKSFAELQELGEDFDPTTYPAEIDARLPELHASFETPDGVVEVDATRTHSVCALMMQLTPEPTPP